jgi:hypothetical protein
MDVSGLLEVDPLVVMVLAAFVFVVALALILLTPLAYVVVFCKGPNSNFRAIIRDWKSERQRPKQKRRK